MQSRHVRGKISIIDRGKLDHTPGIRDRAGTSVILREAGRSR